MKNLIVMLCILTCLCSLAFAVDLDPEKFMTADKIKPGMKGTGNRVRAIKPDWPGNARIQGAIEHVAGLRDAVAHVIAGSNPNPVIRIEGWRGGVVRILTVGNGWFGHRPDGVI